MIINTNQKSYINEKHIITTKYDFLFINYHQLVLENDDIKAIYLIGNWNQISINLTKMFEANQFIFEIQMLKKTNEYHYITFENNYILNKFVELYKEHWKFLSKPQSNEVKIIELEKILKYLDYDLLEYFEPIIINYFINRNSN